MRSVVRLTVALICAALLSCALIARADDQAPAKPLTEDEKIERLIHTVDQLQDATFIRNGTEYDCHAAAKHMRDKWDYGRKKIKTAGDFIDKVASKSSVSGKPYHIRFKDGRDVESGNFLRDELKKIEGEDSPPSR
ncbi:hypothetical protein BH09PLA1_BH09PLA1_20960 [soil metagenome]